MNPGGLPGTQKYVPGCLMDRHATPRAQGKLPAT